MRLADDHAVQAGRHVEQVPHHVLARALEKIVENIRQVQAVKIRQELGDFLMRRRRRRHVARRVYLDPIARRQHHRFGRGKTLAQIGKRRARLFGAKGQSAARLDRRRVMTQPADLIFHAVPSA